MDTKKAVMYGAGNIGRGFIGQVLHDSGYRVVFIDVNAEIVDALNKNGGYTQLIVSDSDTSERFIDNVRAVNGGDAQAVIDEIASCDLMAVSVGAAVLPRIAPNIAGGVAKRMSRDPQAFLNILICENIMHSSQVLGDLLRGVQGFDAGYLGRVGLVQTTIGRMVPALSEETRRGDPAKIAVEPFCELPVDRDAFKGGIPELAHAIAYSPFGFFEDKKLLIHNMGHAMTAYLGYLKGCQYIWQAVEDPEIFAKVRSAMLCVADAMAKEYRADRAELAAHADDLLSRFGNRALKDTVARVGGDPMRKLGPDDRFMGAVSKCKSQGVGYDPILYGIAAALRFRNAGDATAPQIKERLDQIGPAAFLRNWSRLSDKDSEQCETMYKSLTPAD